MSNLISERVAIARAGKNPYVIAKLPSGWLVIGMRNLCLAIACFWLIQLCLQSTICQKRTGLSILWMY